jgi:hypothetical protein
MELQELQEAAEFGTQTAMRTLDNGNMLMAVRLSYNTELESYELLKRVDDMKDRQYFGNKEDAVEKYDFLVEKHQLVVF